MSPTFLKGYKQPLGLQDLPTITRKLNVSNILSIFLENYKSSTKKEEKKEEEEGRDKQYSARDLFRGKKGGKGA